MRGQQYSPFCFVDFISFRIYYANTNAGFAQLFVSRCTEACKLDIFLLGPVDASAVGFSTLALMRAHWDAKLTAFTPKRSQGRPAVPRHSVHRVAHRNSDGEEPPPNRRSPPSAKRRNEDIYRVSSLHGFFSFYITVLNERFNVALKHYTAQLTGQTRWQLTISKETSECFDSFIPPSLSH